MKIKSPGRNTGTNDRIRIETIMLYLLLAGLQASKYAASLQKSRVSCWKWEGAECAVGIARSVG